MGKKPFNYHINLLHHNIIGIKAENSRETARKRLLITSLAAHSLPPSLQDPKRVHRKSVAPMQGAMMDGHGVRMGRGVISPSAPLKVFRDQRKRDYRKPKSKLLPPPALPYNFHEPFKQS